MNLSFLLLIVFFSFLAGPAEFARQTQTVTEPGASIAGRVTLRGEPVPGVVVVVRHHPPTSREQATGKTDANGQYRITNIPAGSYAVMPNALALTTMERYVRMITLDRGENRENVDFSLVRGAVITGRVFEANGRPIIGERISIVGYSNDSQQPSYRGSQMFRTDDRGVYRAFGLPPGRYKISVGAGAGSSYRRLDQGQSYYPHTYHPGVTEDAKASFVELSEGDEASGVDIVVSARAKTFEASGRIVDAETGRPQPGINWGYGGNAMSTFGRQSDENGEFKITGLMPGRYSVFAGCEGDYYMDPVEFDIADSDVIGLEIRRYRGASISGKVVVDGVSDPAVLGKLKEVSLIAGGAGSSIDPDGSYYFCGLRPGRVKVSADSLRGSGFWLTRVDRGGVDIREGVNVSPGDHLTDVRIVLGYATGVIRGQVTWPGDQLPQGVRLQIQARRIGDDERSHHLVADTDERGRFVFEGLISGEYELTAGSTFSSSVPGARIPRLQRVTQRLTVSNEGEATVTLALKSIEEPKPH